MSLKRYREKRDFRKTPEPAGKRTAGRGHDLSFVVQKHDARRLHYDFRLELDGVLKSWAVPKGPCLNPKEGRLAVHVEDHPLAYGGFEGSIPEGNYGAGNVIIWDRGIWNPGSDPREGYRKGHLKFQLHGEKLKGGWSLFRIGHEGKSDNWLLKKTDDRYAKTGEAAEITAQMTKSVETGLEVEEAGGLGREWGSRKEAKASAARARRGRKGPLAPPDDAPKRPFPEKVSPQLATLVDSPPEGADWLHEIKFDGYRLIAAVRNGRAVLESRQGKGWTNRFRMLADDLSGIAADSAVLDGEAVVLDAEGRSNFQLLQNALNNGRAANVIYYAFDLLYLNGRDLQPLSLERRKTLLTEVLERSSCSHVQLSEHIIGSGLQVYADACRMALEGIVSKKRSSTYVPKRTKSWLKVKCKKRQEFVVLGYTPATTKALPFGALHLGYRKPDGVLRYAGKVGTGFSDESRTDLARLFQRLVLQTAPEVADLPVKRSDIWLKPELVCEIEFTEWTEDERLRHPSFKGLREDKAPGEVFKENSERMPAAKRKSKKDSLDEAEVLGIALTNASREVYAGSGVSKLDLAEYYKRIAPRMLPLVIERPLTLVRCPAGARCFYQKHKEAGLSELKSVEIKEEDGSIDEYPYLVSPADVIRLVQMNVIEIHLAGARVSNFERPDRLVFDLDPDPALGWQVVVDAARALRMILDSAGLQSFVKTTGGKGLHIVAPIKPKAGWEEVRAAAKGVCALLSAADPEKFVMVSTKSKRTGKIFLDYLRNGRSASSVAPYSTRARPGLRVSAPVTWNEISKMSPPGLDTGDVLLRRSDPWAVFGSVSQQLSLSALKRVGVQL